MTAKAPISLADDMGLGFIQKYSLFSIAF